MEPGHFEQRVLIAGGGPAGMMLGYLLARAGIGVTVLEKHADFLRDFRGDTVHPSTMEVLHDLGLIERFLTRPHDELREIRGMVGGQLITITNLGHLPVRCPFIALMPQWEFLDFLAEEARAYPAFRLEMGTGALDIVEDGGVVTGLRIQRHGVEEDWYASLVVAADGRSSVIRDRAGLKVNEIGTPIDVLWMRVPKTSETVNVPLGNVVAGRVFVALDRGDYYQCAFVIGKGAFDEIRTQGLDAFRREIVRAAPSLASGVGAIMSWDEVRLLTVKIDHLTKWHRPGLLCIGDAAHAMSPIGGIGINLAIQDAVAAANILIPALRRGTVTDADLAAVQKRREWPTRATQRAQAFAQDQIIRRVLERKAPINGAPWPLRMLNRFPILRRIPARFLGMGLRPEHPTSLG
jgi:2-polyprenyl-6-methoxyphenol hydroxylase-like FAD-dependent oxidoreductase